MYYFLSLISGFIIAFMILFNGMFTQQYGVHFATVFIHLSGLLLISAIVLIKRARPFARRHAWFLYIGGSVGVLTTVFNNVAFGRISVSALLALVLLGQSVSGLAFDQFGWLGMPRHPLNKRRIIGLVLTIGGIAVMIDRFDTLAVLLSFFAGCTIVTSRTLNAKLAELTTVGVSTFFNYLVGFAVSIPVFLLFGMNEKVVTDLAISGSPVIYIGGFLGVCLIMISNVIVRKIPAFHLSLILFIGQVLMGVVIDAFLTQSFSIPILVGGTLVTAGLCIDLIINKAGSRTGPPAQ